MALLEVEEDAGGNEDLLSTDWEPLPSDYSAGWEPLPSDYSAAQTDIGGGLVKLPGTGGCDPSIRMMKQCKIKDFTGPQCLPKAQGYGREGRERARA